MPRSLEYVHSEIVRVADARGVDPRKLLRTTFLADTDVSKHDLESLGGFAALRRDAAAAAGIEPDIDRPAARGVQLRNQYIGKLERQTATIDYLADRLGTAIREALASQPIVMQPRRDPVPPKRIAERTLVGLISDTHYGLCVDRGEVPTNAFGWQQAARRTAKLVEQLALWKPEHRAETDLRICLAGDLIQGAIHVISEGTVTLVAEQIRGAVSILVQALDYLRGHFDRIDVSCISGNHERHPHRGGRATSAKWDSLADPIFLALEYAFRDCEGIAFHVPRTPYATFRLPGNRLAYVTHGDTVTTTGNVGRTINVDSIARQIYALDASGTFDQHISVAMFGHVHVPAISQLGNGCALVINGCLSGTDGYAQSIGIHASNPAQVVFESVPDHALGDSRIVRLSDADNTARLDSIITP